VAGFYIRPMSERWFEDYVVGTTTEHGSIRVDEDELIDFGRRFDPQPFHIDPEAAALKIHPVHGGFRADDPAMYPAYSVLVERGVPLVVHSGTSSFPGSTNAYADPMHLDAVLRDFPDLQVVLAHGGRGWWYDAAAFLAVSRPNVWIELSGLPPKRLPEYYGRFDLGRLARKWIFGTDWPGVPGQAANARVVASLGLPDDVVPLVLGGNALQVYSGLDPA
jgi:predicted TIM-barrel fold metal-dependent hydrolase